MKLVSALILSTFLVTALVAVPFANLRADDLKVRIGYPTALHGEIAEVLGHTDIGAKNGLSVETTFFQYGPPQIEALAAKSIDLSFTSIVPTVNYLSKQPGVVEVIASLGNSSHGLVVPADSTIKSIADFKGKKIAVAYGTDSQIDLLAALKQVGLDPTKDVTLINVPPNEQPAALEQKLADGVLLRQPQLDKYTQKGYREIQQWPHHLWVIARTEFLNEHPEARVKLIEAIREAAFYVTQHPQESAAWFGATLRQDPALVEKIAAENPLYTNVKTLADISVVPSPELKSFAAKRAQELVDFGQTKTVAQIPFAP